MFRFLFRLSIKMITTWKREIMLVILGILISSCAVIKFTDNITNFRRYYDDVKGTREERIFHENRIHFSFQNSKLLDKVVEQLKKQEGIQNVVLKGNFEIISGQHFPVASYSSIPILTEYDNSIGITPDHVENGTIVLSYGALCNLEGSNTMSNSENGVIETYDEEPSKSQYQIVYSCDEPFFMGGKSYRIVAENFNFEENLISLRDFMELDKTGKLSELELVYIYDDDFSNHQISQAEDLIRSIKLWKDTYKEHPDNTLSISDYLDLMGNLIIGVILAVLNALFIYQSLLKQRIASYSILKLLGLKNFMLRVMILFEMLIIFIVSFTVAGMLFFLYCTIAGELIYNLRYSIGYSFCLLLMIYIMLSLLITFKLIKRQPFETYVDNR